MGSVTRWLRGEHPRWLLVAGLQFVGWAAYGVIYYFTLRPHNPFADIVRNQALIAASSGLTFSSLLGWGYERAQVSQLHPGWEVFAVFVGALGMGSVWYQVNHWGADWVDPFEVPVFAHVALLPGQGSVLSSAEAFPIVLFVWSGFYLGIAHWYERQEKQQRLLQADAAAQRARLQMLRYQLNPHFFFNALNTINALADENPRRVKKAVHELSGFLRYSLLDDDTFAVPLHKEIRAVEHYLAVEKMRFEEDLEVTVDVEAGAGRQPVPAFLVLPLVENAIKHGQHTSPSPLRIRIAGALSAVQLTVEVTNTGSLRDGQSADIGTGTGLDNVRARLRALYPGQHTFALHEEGGWVHARIEIETAAVDRTEPHA